MKAFYDLEFAERGGGIPIQPISIGVVVENGDEFYAINEECLSNVAMIPWLANNVWPHLPVRSDGYGIIEWDKDHEEGQHVLALDRLVHSLRTFLTGIPNLELWGYYSHYDHVVLCQMFGKMTELPTGIPQWTHELMQEAERYPDVAFPAQYEKSHHALWDARWNRDLYYRLFPRPEQAVGFIGAPDAGLGELVAKARGLAVVRDEPTVQDGVYLPTLVATAIEMPGATA